MAQQQNSEQKKEVRCLALPVGSNYLILPNATIAEIAVYKECKEIKSDAHWLNGLTEWRGLYIPMVDIGQMISQSAANKIKPQRLAVINTLIGNRDMPFYAIALSGIPHIMNLSAGSLKTDTSKTAQGVELARVQYFGIPYVIPNVDYIEMMLKNQNISVPQVPAIAG